MHFSIPDTTDVSAKKSSNQQSYTLFNIYINGIHHCGLRYSQLYTFNTELQRLFPTAMLDIESFPPKKIFSLSSKDTEERRISLEQYLQSIARSRHITTSTYFNEFFLNAQVETFATDPFDANEKIDLTICLLNKHELIIEDISSKNNTTYLLDACGVKIQLQKDFLFYFGLYLYELKDNQLNLLRPLYDFESPFLSLKHMKQFHDQTCIVLKKSYWNSNFDSQLIEDRRARNLLFVQAQYEIEQSQTLYSSDIYSQLESLRENNSFKDYLLLARTSKFYGYIILKQCSILYPINDLIKQKLCQCSLAIGNNEMICCLNSSNKTKEVLFKVSRIRCWKVHWTKQDMNISLEYLIKKDSLEWIKIHTEQAALVSICLQSMVDEILAKKAGATSPTSITTTTTAEQPSAKVGNTLSTRTQSYSERYNNSGIFNGGDDDL